MPNTERFPIETLKHCSDRTKKALRDSKVKGLMHIADASRLDGRSPAELLRYTVPGIGDKAIFELFDSVFWALIEQVESTPALTDHQDHDRALALIGTMIQSTKGDIGGRDQAKLFAEIAFDMIDAVRLEGQKRREALQ
ncbi:MULTISPECIES: hypothetical protein [unclassified Acidovorax]|uniref:hypothetical protein n=1 Tax=unclassified Acidovorax TaxID=2684926 RepID=UPI001C45DC97|nr:MULTISPECIES: hypothetical protein [unclassified Acidovorax]MBV7459814.1 hypothetical protein [Acidovorax sp. sif0632]MBV7464839.1 hypothetical protein [Acidovorax sp. sif0613]